MKYETRISEANIQKRIGELAAEINAEYPENSSLVLISVLKGGFVFTADLMRLLEADIQVSFIQVSSYGDRMSPNGKPSITKDVDIDISKKHVLIVEDIVDSGHTVNFLLRHFSQHIPASLKVYTLLKKNCDEKINVPLDYVGFYIDSGFVLGYGLDYGERFRQLKEIVTVIET